MNLIIIGSAERLHSALIKAGWDELCDRLVFVEAPRAVRIKRGRLRGMDEAQFAAREAAQTPLAEKKTRQLLERWKPLVGSRKHLERSRP